MGRRRALVLVLVHVLVALHVAHWMASGETLSPLEPSEAMEFTKHDVMNAGFVFFGLTILSTLVLGRWFCGWACHLVALQDGCLWLLKRVGIRPRPLRSRLLAWVPAIAAAYMFAWPLVYRLWIGASPGTPRLALTRGDFWSTFPPWPVAAVTFVVCGFAIVYFLGAKGFCTYACPYGAIFGLVDRLAPGRIRVTDACEGCGHCTATCTSNVLVHLEVREHGMVVDPGCMKCLDCVSVCPKDALYFGFGKPSVAALPAGRSRLRWGRELSLAVAFVATFVVVRGLYGVVPFLLALGTAGILAPCLVQFAQLVPVSEASFLGLSLKRTGRLTRAGWLFTAAMGLATLFLVHGAAVQFHARRAARTFDAVLAEREPFLADPGRPPRTDATLAAGRASTEFVSRYGLLAVAENELERAWFALLSGEPQEFERGMRRAIELVPDPSGLRYDLARFLAVRGRPDEAATELEASLAEHPSAPVFDQLARLRFQQGRVEDAAGIFLRALDAFPDNPDLWFNQGVLLGMLGRDDEAVAAFRKVLELAPGRRDARENLLQLLQSLGRSSEARALTEDSGDGP